MIYPRCGACRYWKGGSDRYLLTGKCARHGYDTHPGYSCRSFQYPARQLMRVVGLGDSEIAWLGANPEHKITRHFRKAFARLQATNEFAGFFDLLERWRAWREMHGYDPQ